MYDCFQNRNHLNHNSTSPEGYQNKASSTTKPIINEPNHNYLRAFGLHWMSKEANEQTYPLPHFLCTPQECNKSDCKESTSLCPVQGQESS